MTYKKTHRDEATYRKHAKTAGISYAVIMADLVMILSDVVVAWVLFELFATVNRRRSVPGPACNRGARLRPPDRSNVFRSPLPPRWLPRAPLATGTASDLCSHRACRCRISDRKQHHVPRTATGGGRRPWTSVAGVAEISFAIWFGYTGTRRSYPGPLEVKAK